MLSKCANPECSAPFRYLREGRIFNIERRRADRQPGQPSHEVEFFWLCKDCALTLRVVARDGTHSVLPLEQDSPNRTALDIKGAAALDAPLRHG